VCGEPSAQHRRRLWCDATQFHVGVDLREAENGETIFENHWRESFAKDHV